jgi:ribonuclease P protein component
LKRCYSLKKNSEFQYVYKAGKRFGGRGLMLVALKSRQGVRVGFSISKKVGGAVVRNLLKRRLRECVRPLLTQLRPCRLVFVVREELVNEPFHSMGKTVQHLIRKADMLLGDSAKAPSIGAKRTTP